MEAISYAAYPARIFHDPRDGVFKAVFADFNDAETFADTLEGVVDMAEDLLVTAVTGSMNLGRNLPRPTPAGEGRMIQLPPMFALKAAIYQSMRDDGVSKAELARRLGWPWAQVDRLVNVNHNSRLDQLESALAVLGRRIVIRVEAA